MANSFKRQGFVSVLGGMNAAMTPTLLRDTQYAYGVNVTSRKGLLHTRPRWRRMPVYLPPGVFQGKFVYRRRDRSYLALCISGTVYLIDLKTLQRFNCGSFPTRSFARAYFCQADRFLIVQNGIIKPIENWPIILDGHAVVDNGSVQVQFDTEEGWIRLRDAMSATVRDALPEDKTTPEYDAAVAAAQTAARAANAASKAAIEAAAAANATNAVVFPVNERTG